MAKPDVATLISQYGNILTSLFQQMSDMFFLMSVEDGGKFRYVLMNAAAMRTAGLTEDAYGKLIDDVYPKEKASLLNSMYQLAVTKGEPTHFTTEGNVIGESILTPVFDNDGVCTHVFAVTRDITERKKLESRLEFMAYHDMLTGLPNRRMLYEHLQKAMSAANHQGEMAAVLFLDCDDFKHINDTWGHETGDMFLRMLAERLNSSIRDKDTVARLGGDEFVVLLTAIQSPRQAAKVAERILRAVEQPWSINERSFTVTISIGIALYPMDACDIDSLMRNADKALYQAKAAGRNRYAFFHPLGNEPK